LSLPLLPSSFLKLPPPRRTPPTSICNGDSFSPRPTDQLPRRLQSPELAIVEREVKRMPKTKFILIPATLDTFGHGTHLLLDAILG
jgi:hypothetical protein